MIEHCKGKAWKVQKSPKSGYILNGVAATSVGNAWAVGPTLIEHWNGAAWERQPNPSPGQLLSVAATSGTNAWAVGS